MEVGQDLVQDLRVALEEYVRTVSTKNARSWREFLAVLKVPTKGLDIEGRMHTNFIYYKANYCQIVTGVMVLALLLSPRTLISLGICGAVSFLIFLALRKHRTAAAAATSLVILLVTGTLLWLTMFLLVAVVLTLSHMALRPRSVHARYNFFVNEDPPG